MTSSRSIALVFGILALATLAPRSSAQSLDSTFMPALTFDAVVNSLAMQPDGKAILGIGLGPDFVNANTNLIGAKEVSLVRLNLDGSLDPTFARVPHSSTPYRRSVSAMVLLTN